MIYLFTLKYVPTALLYLITIFFTVLSEDRDCAKEIFLLFSFLISGMYMIYDVIADLKSIQKVHYLILPATFVNDYVVFSTGDGHVDEAHTR